MNAGADGDLYALLDVESTASAEEVRAAYRVLAHRYHPDHNPNNAAAERQMQAINRAFAVLNVPERRADYDRRRARPQQPQGPPDGPHGAGRGQRPYYRGKNWGLHTGAEAPPQYIVRAEPSGFNLVVDPLRGCQARTVRLHNDAPFSVRMVAICSPWLSVSADAMEVPAGGDVDLAIGAAPEAPGQQRGWRDGGVSLFTDDPRVFCPDVRITAIFMAPPPPPPPKLATAEPDLREAEERPRSVWRRFFGR